MKLSLIISPDWGKSGELALALEWRPNGRHFSTPEGLEGRILSPKDDFLFLPTAGSTLHLIEPISPYTAACAQYLLDMRRVSNVTVYPNWHV